MEVGRPHRPSRGVVRVLVWHKPRVLSDKCLQWYFLLNLLVVMAKCFVDRSGLPGKRSIRILTTKVSSTFQSNGRDRVQMDRVLSARSVFSEVFPRVVV